jgi:stringent starvation protein B
MKISWNKCRLITPADDAVVSVSEMKAYLNLGSVTDDDILLRGLIAAATSYIEGPDGIGFCFGRQTYEARFENFPRTVIVPMGPVIDVVATADGEVVEPTWTDLATGEVKYPYTTGPATVRMTVGHDDTDQIPAVLIQAIKMLAASWYNTRENDAEKTRNEVPISVDRVIRNFRRY